MVLTQESLPDALCAGFPDLCSDVRRLADDGPHVVMGQAVLPWLRARLDQGEIDEEVASMFDLIEAMAESEDYRLVNVVRASICESLGDDGHRLTIARSLMGPRTLAISAVVEDQLWR